MKIIIISVLISLLSACGGGEQAKDTNSYVGSGNTNSNMTGTWRSTIEYSYHSVATDEYLYSDFTESTIIFNEDSSGVSYSGCVEYGIKSLSAIKTDEYLYLNFGTTLYTKNADGSYSTAEETHIQYPGMTTTYLNKHTTLSKISSDIITDKGSLIINGPVSVNEDKHVCMIRQYSNITDRNIYDISVPYGDSHLNFRLDLMSKPPIGEVSYTEYTIGVPIFNFEIMSGATEFWDIVSSNILNIKTATFNITESTDSTLGGTYSFVEQTDSNSYSGNFQVELNN